MSLPRTWHARKSRLQALLASQGNEDDDGVAMDRLLHGQSVIGKTAKTSEIDKLRFQDDDLQVVGTLEYGSFGTIDIVTLNASILPYSSARPRNRVYVRKSTEKLFATRARDQCSPQIERKILLLATRSNSPWAPHLFCAYQTATHLNLVMSYAEGGSLWDVLESAPGGPTSSGAGRLPEAHVTGFWAPQIICAIHWCHTQGFVHRDIKPHNFVIDYTPWSSTTIASTQPFPRVLLIDFGSAAPLEPAKPGQTRRRLKKEYCTVPCGTCDYISPEILKAHERALVASELEDDSLSISISILHTSTASDDDDDDDSGTGAYGYGLETDYWSLGAMLYEMVYGAAPFFADNIKRTYEKIMDHKRYLKFPQHAGLAQISQEFEELLRGLLTDAEFRLGRRSVEDIMGAAVFSGVQWDSLHSQTVPAALHLPQFSYASPENDGSGLGGLQPQDGAFAFDALFQSSPGSMQNQGQSNSAVSVSVSGIKEHDVSQENRSATRSRSGSVGSSLGSSLNGPISGGSGASAFGSKSHFIGFSWGPEVDIEGVESAVSGVGVGQTPLGRLYQNPPTSVPSTSRTLHPYATPLGGQHAFATPLRQPGALATYRTPMPSSVPFSRTPGTILRTGSKSTGRRTGNKGRDLSDREAMRQLVDCVGMSARKRVLESGRKPKTKALQRFDSRMRSGSVSGVLGVPPVPWEREGEKAGSRNRSGSGSRRRPSLVVSTAAKMRQGRYILHNGSQSLFDDTGVGVDVDANMEIGTETGTEDMTSSSLSSVPLSPSPSPRPGSAMSMNMNMGMGMTGNMTMMSKRSATPTMTMTMSSGMLSVPGMNRSGVGMGTGTGVNRSGTGMGAVPSGFGRGRAGSDNGSNASRVSIEELEDRFKELLKDIEGLERRLDAWSG